MKRIVHAFGKLNWGNRVFAVFVLCMTTAIALPAQTFTTLFSFDGVHGVFPEAALVQATDGNLYGTTSDGTIFKITPTGTLTTLYRFAGTAAYSPNGLARPAQL